MFWKNKNTVEFDGDEVVLSKRKVLGIIGFSEIVRKKFLAYKDGDEWRGLVGYEEYKEKTDLLEKKLDLILTHLNLEYIPETEKKEPARLIAKKDTMDIVAGQWFDLAQSQSETHSVKTTKPKRKYTKRNKK